MDIGDESTASHRATMTSYWSSNITAAGYVAKLLQEQDGWTSITITKPERSGASYAVTAIYEWSDGIETEPS